VCPWSLWSYWKPRKLSTVLSDSVRNTCCHHLLSMSTVMMACTKLRRLLLPAFIVTMACVSVAGGAAPAGDAATSNKAQKVILRFTCHHRVSPPATNPALHACTQQKVGAAGPGGARAAKAAIGQIQMTEEDKVPSTTDLARTNPHSPSQSFHSGEDGRAVQKVRHRTPQRSVLYTTTAHQLYISD
jgi:hypothetical protein